jgi:uncharacterized membrane protein
MKPTMKILSHFPARNFLFKILLGLAIFTFLVGWLINTPAGLLGKADAIGYAVCHRIPSHSFDIGDRPLPLCARCSGMYLGALLSMMYQIGLGKRGGMPPLKILVVLGIFFAAFGVDGVNSYLHFFPNAPSLYQSQNWLRLITGTGMGLGMGAVLLPVLHQSSWKDWDERPALGSWRSLGGLVGLAALVDLMIISENPLLVYPLAILSAASILIMLSIIYTIVVTLIFKKDNTYSTVKDLYVPMMAGFLIALLQIGAIDIARYWLTGTWQGFVLLS